MWPKTDAQRTLLATAEAIAEQIASTAPAHDRDASFPFEHFEAMRAAGYLGAAVPREFGGGGHGLDDLVLAQLAIARGDGSTALAVGMHHMVIGTEVSAQRWPEAARERVFRAARRTREIFRVTESFALDAEFRVLPEHRRDFVDFAELVAQ